jgi:hypothetical protein
MLFIDTCVLLAVLTPEAHSATATAFLAEASAPLAISSWSVTEPHSALGRKVRTKALSHALQSGCSVRDGGPTNGPGG